MVSRCGIGSSALAVAAVIFLIPSSTARADPGQGGARAAAAASASPFATQIAELRQIRTLLEQADHDYQGHRAAAVKLITTAIHTLHPPKPSTGQVRTRVAGTGTGAKQATPKVGNNGGNNEPQAVSDAQLKQAMTALAAVQTQLAGAPGNTAATTAAAALGKAVQELQTALSIK
jgi:hypothetical protein